MSKQQAAVKSFVLRFLALAGATVRSDSARDDVYHVYLPEEIARHIQVERRLSIAFLPTNTSAEYITVGHPMLDRMLLWARQRGLASSLLFTFSMEPDFVNDVMAMDPFDPKRRKQYLSSGVSSGPLMELIRQAKKIRVSQGRLRIIRRRLLHQRQLLFFYKVSLLSDEKWDLIVPLLIDPVTERIDRPVDITKAVSFSWHLPDKATQSEGYTAERLYRAACSHLERRLEGKIRGFQQEASRRCQDESARIVQYYDGLAHESLEPLKQAFRRISSVGRRADMARAWQRQSQYEQEASRLKQEIQILEAAYRDEIEELEKEKVQHLMEVKEKYRARIEIELTHAAYVMVPRVEWRLRIQRDGIQREVELVYDVLRRTFVDWRCESCESMHGHLTLCSCDGLVCEACHTVCASCGKIHCELCLDERCHMCNRVTCSTCITTCPMGKEAWGADIPTICQHCRSGWCDSCQSGSLLHSFNETIIF